MRRNVLLILHFLIGASICSVRGANITCYCNSALCAKFGYLCVTEMGCFKEALPKPAFLPPSAKSSWYPSVKTGCLEHMSVDRFYKCWSDDVWDILKNPSKIRLPGDSAINVKELAHGGQAVHQTSSGRNNDRPAVNSFGPRRYARTTDSGVKKSFSTGVKTSSKDDSSLECCFKELCNEDVERVSDQQTRNKDEVVENPTSSQSNAAKSLFTMPLFSFVLSSFSFATILLVLGCYFYRKWRSYRIRQEEHFLDMLIESTASSCMSQNQRSKVTPSVEAYREHIGHMIRLTTAGGRDDKLVRDL